MAKSGWIKLHRKLKESEIWKGHQPFDKRSAWLDLLLRATHKPSLILVKNQQIKVKPGQFFVSQKGLSESWNWSRHKVANFLNVLAGKNRNKMNQMITKSEPIAKIGTAKRTYLGFIITIVNWELYQSDNSNKDTKKDTKRDTNGTPTGHKQECTKNVKESKPKPCEAKNLASPPSLPEYPARQGKKERSLVLEQTTTQEEETIPKSEMSQIREVFKYWQEVFEHPKALLSKDRVGKIRSRLREDYTIPQLKRSIDGCKASSYHMGDNKHGKVYDSIGLIFRSAEKVEDFWGYLKKRESPSARKLKQLREKERS